MKIVRKNNGGRPRKQKNDPELLEKGYITIPYKVDKKNFIETCLRTGTVSVITDGGNFRNEILITNEALQNINFPNEEGGYGTQVIIASLPYRTTPVVIGTILNDDQSPAWKENIHRFMKINDKTSVCIEEDADDKSINIIVNSEEATEINISSVGTEESVLNIQSSGKANIIADKEINAISYEKITSKIVNVETEAEEEGKEERSVTMTLESLLVKWLENDKTSTILFDKDRFKLSLHDDLEIVDISDDAIIISFKNNEEQIVINSDNIDILFKNGEEKVTLSPNLIKLLTGSKVEVNGAKEPLTLAETLISKIDELQNQINMLKQAWTQAAAGVKPMDGGAGGFAIGISTVASISKVDFSEIKSKTTFSD